MTTIARPTHFQEAATAAFDAWTLTQTLTPRLSVRLAAVDAYGQVLNQYTGHRQVSGEQPDRPWAVYLAGTDGRFRLLCFDLDAKTSDATTAAERDAALLAGLLTEAGLPPVVCQSGPAGGRHVWAALAEGVDAETVATLARLAHHLCPTLDLSPLTNAATGCVRPPGAPHRNGGRSTVLSGDLHALTEPTGTAAGVRTLVERLAGLVDTAEPPHPVDPRRPLPLDEHARPYLPGPRRELPTASAAALREDAAAGDASAVLWRVLIGAASARWRYADVAALVPTSPGLEHVRSYRDRAQRHPRGPVEAARLLRRQWHKAVSYVAGSDRQIGEDPTFDARADAIAAHVRQVQHRADAAAGRWTRGGGPADRRILDALCILSLQALSACVEADTRRLALLAGVGRETARTSLLRLAEDGWISRSRAADGPHGAAWTTDPRATIHSSPTDSRSQADPRPAGAGSAERTTLLASLTTRAQTAAHDAFTMGPGLGHFAGNTYARTDTEPQPLAVLAQATGASTEQMARTLARLSSVGLLKQDGTGWYRPAQDHRAAAAHALGVTGRLADRAARYSLERELWAWWQAEETWMNAPRRTAHRNRPGKGQLALLPETGTHAYGPYPRRADGRADHRAARRELAEERAGIAARQRPGTTPPLCRERSCEGADGHPLG
ncbi:hypothetical protein, partial [Citricoccus sp. GCM10030269]|uniref:hypothetical protein n=1 Tax=Citricoccus sp. GCM10030269 TaxID=3273388 RepID=UPI00360D13FD